MLFSKAFAPIWVALLEPSAQSRLEQSLNALSPMPVMVSGIETDVRELHSENIPTAILVRLSGIITDVRFEHMAKAQTILVTLSGIEMVVIGQKSNASSPMLVTLFDSFMLARRVQA